MHRYTDYLSDVMNVIVEMTNESLPGSLLQVSKLRNRLPHVNKKTFDEIMVSLMKDCGLVLHHHDAPFQLSVEERKNLVLDDSHVKDVYYVGFYLPRAKLEGEDWEIQR